jgi:glycosyltransferase involved in cell wall biosynthesis
MFLKNISNIGDVKKEIILVDDGSSDKTKEILKRRIEPMQ